MLQYRTEHDSMGEIKVPVDRLYGPATQRAVENFPISGIRLPRAFIRSIGLIKYAAALTNESLGVLDPRRAKAIQEASLAVAGGQFDTEFVVDVFQTGSGTSTNMNANEVIANAACLKLGGRIGDRDLIDPNDHVNLGQSSNDVFPTAIHLSALETVKNGLLPEITKLATALKEQQGRFNDVLKLARTHLQDAVPMTLGQEFGGYCRQIENCRLRIESVLPRLSELPIGGTAVGTGLNTHKDFGRLVAEALSQKTGHEVGEAGNHFEAQAARDTCVELSGALRVLAVALYKIAGDISWLASGPRAGLREITVPALQPGSSIMPGKVNPVICEMLLQVAVQVFGNDAAIAMGAVGGRFELNLRMPVVAHNLLQSIAIQTSACKTFREKCVSGIRANEEQCAEYVEQGLAVVTALAPVLGYDKSAQIVKAALETNRTIREVTEEMTDLTADQLTTLLDPRRMANLDRSWGNHVSDSTV